MINSSKTKVLLIGSSIFPEDPSIPSIPNVKRNIEGLVEVLANPNLGNIPNKNISVLIDETIVKIQLALSDFTSGTEKDESLIIYYSGHGIIGSKDFNLYLTTRETRSNHIDLTGISINKFAELYKSSNAAKKVLILDCCHSGKIIGALGTSESQLAAQLPKFEGSYVMASADEYTPALFDPEKPDTPTRFTEKLLDVLRLGLDNNQPVCSVGEVFHEVKKRILKDGNMPIPQVTSDDEGYLIPIVNNIKFNLEDSTWNTAKEKDAVPLYYEYLQRFHEGKYSSEAEKRIAELGELSKWKEARDKDIVYSYWKYLNAFPHGNYAEAAMNRIKELTDPGLPTHPSPPKKRLKVLSKKLYRIILKVKGALLRVLLFPAYLFSIIRKKIQKLRMLLPHSKLFDLAAHYYKTRPRLIYGSVIFLLMFEFFYSTMDRNRKAIVPPPYSSPLNYLVKSAIPSSQLFPWADSIPRKDIVPGAFQLNITRADTVKPASYSPDIDSSKGLSNDSLVATTGWSQNNQAEFIMKFTKLASATIHDPGKAENYCECLMGKIMQAGNSYASVKSKSFSRLRNQFGSGCD